MRMGNPNHNINHSAGLGHPRRSEGHNYRAIRHYMMSQERQKAEKRFPELGVGGTAGVSV